MLRDLINASRMNDDLNALSASNALIWFTPQGDVFDANDNFCNALRYKLEEIVGQHHRIFCEDSIRNSPDYPAFWADLAAGKSKRGQYRRQTKDGQDIWMEASYNPVFHNGKVVRDLQVAADITKTKIAALDDENRIRAIGQSQAIIEFEPDGTTFHANKNFLDTMGYSFPQIEGKHHRIFCGSGYAASLEYAKFWERLRSGEYIAANFIRYGENAKKV